MHIWNLNWSDNVTITTKSYVCGYCGKSIASQRGYNSSNKINHVNIGHIYICHNCHSPTYFDPEGVQTPGPLFGEEVKNLPTKEVTDLYQEARKCASAGVFTGSVLCCRKLLMNISVAEGATEGLKFVEYIDYLEKYNFLPPKGRDWVDHIRKKGNEATHEIAIMTQEDAEESR